MIEEPFSGPFDDVGWADEDEINSKYDSEGQIDGRERHEEQRKQCENRMKLKNPKQWKTHGVVSLDNGSISTT